MMLPVIFRSMTGVVERPNQPVPPPRIAPSQVYRILNDDLGLEAGPLTHLKPGAWSSVFAFEAGSKSYVVRFSSYPEDFDKDAFAWRFRTDRLPIPCVTHRGTLDGTHFAISERVPGAFIDDLDGTSFRRVLPSLLQTLDELRTADLKGTTGYGGWDKRGNGLHGSWLDYLRWSVEDSPDQRGGPWRSKLEQSPVGADAFDRDLPVFLRRIADIPETRHLIHGDMLNYNMFVEGDHVSGVIDWGCAMYGDFVYEIAWFSFWWPWYVEWRGIDMVKAVRTHLEQHGVDLTAYRERMLVYQLQIGLTHQAYHANTGNWAMLEAITHRTSTIADEIR